MNVQEELLKQKIDPALSAQTLSEISEEATGEALSVSGWESLSGGCWNRVIRVEFAQDRSPLVFKISPHPEDAKVMNEYRVHRRFETLDALRTPKALLLDTSQKQIPGTVFVMEHLPGALMHACFGLFSPEDQSRIIASLADDLAGLHEIREEGFGSCALPQEERHGSWPDFWLPRFDAVFSEVEESGLLDETFLDRIRRLRPEFGSALAIGTVATLTHYDIWSGNILIDPAAPGGPRIAGYLDLSGFFADYARELSFAEMFGLADGIFYRRYQARHRIDPGFRLRASIYNLKMGLRHVQMYPSEEYYRRLAADCLAFIEAEV